MQKTIQSGLNQLMQKDMDRKDFLKHVGMGVVALTGAAAAIKTLNQLNTGAKKPVDVGYGGSAYGGMVTTSNRTQSTGK